MSQKLTGKIALVTGGNSGIGLATAKQFVAEGAHVFITGRRQDGLDAAIKEIGENVTAVQGDVSNLADLDRLYATIKEQKGHLDILFANAGWGEFVPLEQITEEHFDKTFNINVKGVAFTVQKALPLLKDGSSIILNASISASIGQPAFSIYAATKAAVRSFARTWSVDLKERHIRVNVVSPGIIPTPAHERIGITDEMYPAMLNGAPLGRVGTPDEVAKPVVFLASDDSSYITGIELFVDGGIAQI
ncbi:SDR family oxidoreductase [Nostoc sp.]|uniref:SDR family oxidoreductase n=1 Tax=Nostoc sp. TaxID=1180 RepID=UPI002FFBD3DD